MVEVTGNLWTFPAAWRGITTNGFVKKSGECVMGRGCAKEYASMNPTFPRTLGDKIKAGGNNVYLWEAEKIITFPVKHNWWEEADLELIERSANELNDLILSGLGEAEIVMPRPGCGNGKLLWRNVKPLLLVLPDSVKVITYA